MARQTPKEAFLALGRGELTQDIVYWNMGMPTLSGKMATRMIGPNLFNDTHLSPQGGYDIWGVKYVSNAETGYQSLPEPNNFLIEDITKWHEIVKAPEMPDVDWEAMAKADYEKSGIDRNESAVLSGAGLMPFQQIMAFMGFNEGLCAIYEEPEAVKELLHYMTDFFMPVIEKTLDYYKPDVFYMLDDTASKYNPFFSHEIYLDVFKPIYERLSKPARERGIPISFHNCGRCEDFLDDMVSFGVKYWDPCQTQNDLEGIQKKYGRDLVLCGCWDYDCIPTYPNVTEEEVRQSVRDTIDKYAPNGAFCFRGRALAQEGDELAPVISKWIEEEAMEYGKDYYERH